MESEVRCHHSFLHVLCFLFIFQPSSHHYIYAEGISGTSMTCPRAHAHFCPRDGFFFSPQSKLVRSLVTVRTTTQIFMLAYCTAYLLSGSRSQIIAASKAFHTVIFALAPDPCLALMRSLLIGTWHVSSSVAQRTHFFGSTYYVLMLFRVFYPGSPFVSGASWPK